MSFLFIILKDVKCSGNWMWAAKLPGEGVRLWDACKAMCEVMGQLGVAIDGGKDSLSMAARVGKETVKAPGTCWSASTTLLFSNYSTRAPNKYFFVCHFNNYKEQILNQMWRHSS